MDSRRISNIIAFLMLGSMFILMFFSVLRDSATMDELAHIPAGYSYLTQKDYRLNPEHPPLIKDLAALPLLFLGLNFPLNTKAWAEDINGQWDMGRIFLYESENDPDQILFWSRLPMMLLAIIFGWLLFIWVKGMYGNKVGLLSLFFFSFSPTFIAHSRYVTTDLAAALGFFIGLTTFVRFLENQNAKRLTLAGAALGLALLLKFSLALLIPLYLLLAFLWVLLDRSRWRVLLKLLIIFIIAGVIIHFVYLFHVWNYPQERQIRDSEFILSSFGFRPAVEATLWMAENPILRPLAQYLLGLLMVIQRSAGGNTTYFLGDIASSGWWYYFPVAYFLKEPLAFFILVLVALGVAIKSIREAHEKSFSVFAEWMRDNFVLASSLIFIAVYWLQSMQSSLNIGVRHVLPTYPFLYLLVSRQIIKWARFYTFAEPQNIREWLTTLYERYIKVLLKYAFIGLMLFWLALSAVLAFPGYLTYYNEFVGGARNGYKYIVDSNYDWGQDLKGLQNFVEKNNIESIAVDYFGGGSPSYYLGEKFEPWWSARGKPNPAAGDPEWFAISATFRQSAFGRPVKGFLKKPEDSYLWLQGLAPVSRAGYSIFIYKF